MPALRDFSLAVEEREFLALVGPSGAGKTTVLRLIAGLEAPDEGTITLAGRVVNDVPPERRNVAMVSQNPALLPHLTVYENLAFGLRLRRRPRAEVDRRVHAVAELLDLRDCLQRLPRALAGGERQRVALGRAMVRDAQVFLLDEPLSQLDAPRRVQMRAELRRLHEQIGATTLLVTHDQSEALTLGDRVAVLHDGALQQVDRPQALYRQPENLFVAGFIGSPPMNLLDGTVQAEASGAVWTLDAASSQDGVRIPWTLGENFRGRRIVLGLRSEHIRIESADTLPCSGWPATVTAVSPLGPDTHVEFQSGRQRLVVRVPAEQNVRRGEQWRLMPEAAHACFFDATTGRKLERG